MTTSADGQVASTSEAAALYLDLLKRNLARWGEVKIVPLSDKGFLRHTLRNAFALRGLEICQIKSFIAELRETGRDWPDGPTVIGMRRLDNIHRCIETALRDEVPGDIVDAGLWRGGASILMRAVLAALGDTGRTVWCADLCWDSATPDRSPDGRTPYPLVPYRTPPLAAVKANFQKYSMLDGRVKFVIGDFNDTLKAAPIRDIAVLRLDVDTYEATRDVLTLLYAKVAPSGFVIVNDYGRVSGGARRAVDEFRDANDIRAAVVDIDGSGAYWRLPR